MSQCVNFIFVSIDFELLASVTADTKPDRKLQHLKSPSKLVAAGQKSEEGNL